MNRNIDHRKLTLQFKQTLFVKSNHLFYLLFRSMFFCILFIHSLPQIDQQNSRHTHETEMFAWSKESEQLKRFVKQIQNENKKLKDIVLKFEHIALDCMHENERLKQENQHLSYLYYSSKQNPNEKSNTQHNSDDDICYLTLKCLTYDVAQRLTNNNEHSLLLINDTKQRSIDNEKQVNKVFYFHIKNIF